MARKAIGWTLFAAGALVGGGELLYAGYLSGEEVAEFTVWEDGRAQPPQEIEIAEEDLPVRLILTSTGLRRSGPNSLLNADVAANISFGESMLDQQHLYHPGSGDDNSRSHFVQRSTFMPEGQQAGTWRLALDVETGSRIELDRIDMAVRVGTREVNAYLAWGALLVTFAGLGMAVIRA